MNNTLSEYLQTLSNELRDLPEEKREEELREVRQHLEAIVARLVEGGLSREEAIEAAIAQFGEAQRVGRELRRANEKEETPFAVVMAPLAALSCHIALYFVSILVMVMMGIRPFWEPWAIQWPRLRVFSYIPLLDATSWVLYWSLPVLLQVLVLPFVAGLVAARIAPRRAALGVACLYTSLALSVGLNVTPAYWKLNLQAIVFSVCCGAVIGGRRALRARRA